MREEQIGDQHELGARARSWARLLFAVSLAASYACASTPAKKPPPKPRPAPAPAVAPAKLKTVRVKLYASEAYARQTEGWQVEAYRQVRAANRVTEKLGLHLKLVTLSEWPYEGGEDLAAALEALERFDPGAPGELLIGLLPALEELSLDPSELGNGRLFGRHIVLRGNNDALEYAGIRRTLARLSSEQQEAVFYGRREHKASALLLHELGHVLGALHTTDPGALMGPLYNREMSRFTPENAAMIKLGAAELFLPKGPAREAARAALLRGLEQAHWPGWSDPDKARLIRKLSSTAPSLAESPSDLGGRALAFREPKKRGRGGPPGGGRGGGRRGPPGRDTQGGSGADRGAGSESSAPSGSSMGSTAPAAGLDPQPALALLSTDPAAAEAKISALLSEAPEAGELLGAACVIAASQPADAKPPMKARLARCEGAIKAFPSDASYRLALAQLSLTAGHRRAALKELRAAHGLLQLEGTASENNWAYLAGLYQRMDYLSWAEAAAAKAGELGASVRGWAAQARDVYELSAGAPIKPAAEPAYIQARKALYAALKTRRLKDTERAAAKLQAAYPRMPSPDLELCQLYANKRRYPAAKARCVAALKQDGLRSRARILLAYIALNQRKPKAAVPWLKQALAEEPGRKDLWTLLGSAYRMSGQRARLKELEATYKARFGAPLPRR